MAWQMIDDLNGEVVAPDQARALAITLDGDPLAAYDVTARSVDELLADLGRLLVDGIAARIGPDEPLDPGPLVDMDAVGRLLGVGAGDGAAVNESAEEQPVAVQPIESAHVTTAPPVDESAEEPPAAPQPAAGQDTAGPDSSTTDWSSDGRDPAVAGATGAPTIGEAERGQATDAVIRRWNRTHTVTPLPPSRRVPTWLREQYERLDGGEPDEACRNVAAYHEPERTPAPADESPQAMAERMLRNRSTPRAVADATGLDVAEVRDLDAAMRKTKGRGR